MWIWVAAGLGLIPLAIMAVAAHVGWKVSHPRRKPLERFPEDEGLVGEKVEFGQPARASDLARLVHSRGKRQENRHFRPRIRRKPFP